MACLPLSTSACSAVCAAIPDLQLLIHSTIASAHRPCVFEPTTPIPKAIHDCFAQAAYISAVLEVCLAWVPLPGFGPVAWPGTTEGMANASEAAASSAAAAPGGDAIAPAAAEARAVIDKEGFLTKQSTAGCCGLASNSGRKCFSHSSPAGVWLKDWRRRYFKLIGNQLHFAKTADVRVQRVTGAKGGCLARPGVVLNGAPFHSLPTPACRRLLMVSSTCPLA